MAALVTSLLSWLCLSAVFLPGAYSQGNGAVRLYRNGGRSISYTSGIVEALVDGIWGNICEDSSFGSIEADVICQQLQYTGASSYTYSGADSSYGTDIYNFVLDDVYCSSSSYQTILQCSYSQLIDSNCLEDYDDVIVTCYTTRLWDNPYTGQIRLNGSSYITNGLVEVYCNGEWGTICDDSFSSNAADTICIQLGYNDGTYNTGPYQGKSDQPIWLNNVYCSSDYSCLSSCQTCPSSEVSICGHNEDINVFCSYNDALFEQGSYTYTCDFDYISDLLGLIVGLTIAGVVVTCALVIGIPICICCCLGVGVGAAVRSSSRRTTTTTVGTTAAMSTTVATQQGTGPPQIQSTTAYYPAPAGVYPTTTAAYPQAAYPPAGYPAAGQDPQAGNEAKPPPYPTQGGYPMQEYPPQAY